MASASNHGEASTSIVTTTTANKVLPFRVLLQLFADQDVLQNGRLTAAFDIDQGQTMTFYVPQILSFLCMVQRLHPSYSRIGYCNDANTIFNSLTDVIGS